MHTYFLISLWIHLITAMVWIGGMLFMVMVLMPTMRQPDFKEQAPAIIGHAARKFKRIGWSCLLVLFVTGITNLIFKGFGDSLHTGGFWQLPYAHMLATKIVLLLIIVCMSVYHDLKMGPATIEAMKANPDAPETIKMRKSAVMHGRVTLLLSLVMVTLGLLMARGLPF